MSGGEIRERHLVGARRPWHPSGAPCAVNPFGGSHLAIASASRKRPIDSLRCRTEHAVKRMVLLT
jgi:hypothetical protein